MESWIQVNPASGRGNSDVYITLQENTEDEDRGALLEVITAGNVKKLLNIIQKGTEMNVYLLSDNTIYKINKSTGEQSAITDSDRDQLFNDAKNKTGLFYLNKKNIDSTISYTSSVILLPDIDIYSEEGKVFSLSNYVYGYSFTIINGTYSQSAFPTIGTKLTLVLSSDLDSVNDVLINDFEANGSIAALQNYSRYSIYMKLGTYEVPAEITQENTGSHNIYCTGVLYDTSTNSRKKVTIIANAGYITSVSSEDAETEKIYQVIFPSDTDGAEATSITLNGEEIPGNELPIAPTNPEEKLPNARFFIAAGNNFYEAFCSVNGFTGSLVFMKGGIGTGGVAEGITFGQIVQDSTYTLSLHYFYPSYT